MCYNRAWSTARFFSHAHLTGNVFTQLVSFFFWPSSIFASYVVLKSIIINENKQYLILNILIRSLFN